MPIYEYQCRLCGHRLEAFQKMSDAVLTECPECKAEALQKLVSAAQFQLKGTGWYVTDFKNKSSSSPESGNSNNSATNSTTTSPPSSTSTDKKADDL